MLSECIDSEGRILLSKYIIGYEELYKFLNLLGTVFGWVSTDVDAKLDVLREHRKSEASANYQDVRSMLKYEVSSIYYLDFHATSKDQGLNRQWRSLGLETLDSEYSLDLEN